jgi:hypothetical protein
MGRATIAGSKSRPFFVVGNRPLAIKATTPVDRFDTQAAAKFLGFADGGAALVATRQQFLLLTV